MLAMMDAHSSSGQGCSHYGEHRFNGGDPYLHWPVVLDEYIKNRQVWLCPSSQHVGRAKWIVPQYTPVYWWYLRDHGSDWGSGSKSCAGACCEAWPPGWGGSVTDSLGMGANAENDPNTFTFSIATTAVESYNRSTSEIGDTAKWIVVGDAASGVAAMQQAFGAAYASACCWGLSDADTAKFYSTDPSFRKKYAPHMGGLNMGFADGHAKWWDGEAAVAQAGGCCTVTDGKGNNLPCYPHKDLSGLCPDFEVTSNIH
jgi:prepilin-type processing-associated H-X9-DG protein